MEYQFREGSRISGVDPQIVGEELDRINHQYGYLQPGIIVEESKDSDAPLHPIFEWDDIKAGKQYREWQARNLIKSVVIIEGKKELKPVYVHIRTGDRVGKYITVDMAIADHDLFQAAIAELQEKITSLAKSIEKLKAAAEESGNQENIFKAIAIADSFNKYLEHAPLN